MDTETFDEESPFRLWFYDILDKKKKRQNRLFIDVKFLKEVSMCTF